MRAGFVFILMASILLMGCGEKSAYEMKAEQDAKARADRNQADHSKRSQ
jgi:major membrane immunogen (membrane-anchored lipoprotein)